MKEREKLYYNTDKEDVNILRPPRLLLAIRRKKRKSKWSWVQADIAEIKAVYLLTILLVSLFRFVCFVGFVLYFGFKYMLPG